ncbi:dihydrofolate reductase family protein [Actinotalea fermentans]|uniref:Deaminase n=1 Tax=Actinotalea fermentans TaxID=43671 RepID=A0A511YZB2_9CELL|nr:dihydrofolate reductase family protein [Actinotalea fermentans]KGM17321.1 deaminase/reductase [Actinotalea fermentans ATCC 43279 = JCM 9966 = DSM 3133]GEN80524.1 deaminase [Actinotalea fermentans]
MPNLIYLTNVSLDGYIEDASGRFDWSQPDPELHQFFNDLTRPIGTFLYGRRLYDSMAVWETDPDLAAGHPVTEEFAEVWKDADKVVYSTTLEAPRTTRTRVERAFDPAAVRELKAAATRDLTIGGAGLAAQALTAGLIDEVQLVVHPVIVGGGKPALPDGVRADLTLLDERRFPAGHVYLRYAVAHPA